MCNQLIVKVSLIKDGHHNQMILVNTEIVI